MQSPLLLSSLLAVTIGACGSQSLTPDMTGTGGTGAGGTGAGGTGGRPLPGTGGFGGSIAAECSTLSAEYQSALTAAETCQVGASGQCQTVVRGNLAGCSCPVYATDTSALTTIEYAWEGLSCEAVFPPPPCAIDCPVALNTVCVSTDGGSAGFCSYVPGTGGVSGSGGSGAGGTSGAGGSSADGGPSVCDTLASEYAAVMEGAKSCTAGTSGQCAQLVPSWLSACPACTDYVNDRTVLDAIRQEWISANCQNVPTPCGKTACATPASTACVPSDAGGSVCVTSYAL